MRRTPWRGARSRQGERADTRLADTMERRTARARQSQRERADTMNIFWRRTARARRSQGERANTREANTLARRTARARQTQQAYTPEWSRLPVLNQPNPAAINLEHEHQCSHCNARQLSEENESFCCREGKVAITHLRPLPEGWEEMFRMPTFRYDTLFEAVSCCLCDITENETPCGDKVFVCCGEFRQIPPVIPGGRRSTIVEASIKSSPLWTKIALRNLTHPQRDASDAGYSHFIDLVGDEDVDTTNSVDRDTHLTKREPMSATISEEEAIQFIFPDVNNTFKCSDCAIITGTNVREDE